MRSAVDVWMKKPLPRQKIFLFLLGLPAITPLVFMSRAVFDANNVTLNGSVADTLGTGGELLLILTLLITPMIVLTQQRWFFPLRRWFGIVFALTIISDATIASITTNFAGGVAGRVAGHTFLLAGFTMVVLVLPLLMTAHPHAQRWLGKYWAQLHKLIYVIWGFLFVHLMLLEGFGFQHGANGSGHAGDGDPIFHQRLYQFAAASLFLFVLRLPPVKRWALRQQKAGRSWVVWATVSPLIVIFVIAVSFMINEEIFKGLDSLNLTPSDE